MLKEKTLNEQQMGLIKLSLNHLSPSRCDFNHYEEGQRKQKAFKKKWWPIIKANFTMDEIREIFMGLNYDI